MTRGEGEAHKLHYRGQTDDFIVFIDSAQDLERYKADEANTTPLSSVVSKFKVYVTHKHGNQGPLDEASKEALHSEFETEDIDEVLRKILRSDASVRNVQVAGRDGHTNESNEGGR